LEESVTGSTGTTQTLKTGDRIVDEAFALQALPRRTFGAHKWGVGGVVIIAGGPGYIGAAALSAMAAGRAGAGIINLAVPRGAMGAIATIVPEAVFIPLPEGDLDSSLRHARESIGAKLARSKAAVVGPGLGEDEYADALLGTIFGRRGAQRGSSVGFRRSVQEEQPISDASGQTLIGGEIPAVVDADGLNWLAKQPDWWASTQPGSLVLTPHVGEMSRLIGRPTEEILADPARVAREAAATWKQVVVLKYGNTVATDGERTLVASDVPFSLATAGSGDVLAGTIGAFLAQGVRPLEAAGLALYLGSKAARRVESRFGVLGLVASDLPAAIAEEIAVLEQKRDDNRG
jgi:NAD(P)H-hydrate repair Nnr-like enzyme with NAD(P)H-hydrate dehydratase domain